MLLFIPETFGDRLKRLRTRAGLTQQKLGEVAGVSASRVSALETGYRSPSDLEVSRLASVFATTVEALCHNTDHPQVCQRLAFTGPRRFEPQRDRETYQRLRGAWKRWPTLSRDLQSALLKRPDRVAVLQALRRIACDSDLEALLLQHLMVLAGEVGEASPMVCGFRKLAICDPEGREFVGDCLFPALRMNLEGLDCVLFFQVTVLAGGTGYRLDCLMGVRQGLRTIWLDLEADGQGHDATYDQQREQDVGLPTLRFTEAEIASANFPSILRARLRGVPGLQ